VNQPQTIKRITGIYFKDLFMAAVAEFIVEKNRQMKYYV